MNKEKWVYMYQSPEGYYNQCKYYIDEYTGKMDPEYRKGCEAYIKFYEENDGNIIFDINDGIFKIKGE